MTPDGRFELRDGDMVSIGQHETLHRVIRVYPNGTATLISVTTGHKTTVACDRLTVRFRDGKDMTAPQRP